MRCKPPHRVEDNVRAVEIVANFVDVFEDFIGPIDTDNGAPFAAFFYAAIKDTGIDDGTCYEHAIAALVQLRHETGPRAKPGAGR